MTQQPPPPPPLPPPAGSGGPPAPTGPARPYASWGIRVVAYLLDGLVVAIPAVVVLGIGGALIAGAEGEGGGLAAVGGLLLVLGYVAAIGLGIWNQGWRQGEMGQSLGKQAMDITVVRELDGEYLGGGQGTLRWLLMVILGGACILNYLWPLWDDKSQCWHDMIVKSVVVQTG